MLGVVCLWWFRFAGDEIKATVEETMAPVMGGVSSVWQWSVEAVMRLKERATGAHS